MARPNKRSALATLGRARLAELATGFEVEVRSSASKSELVDAVAHSKRASFERVLELLMRDELKEICRAHGLDDSGKMKQPIIDRILGKEDAPALPGVFENEVASAGEYSDASQQAAPATARDAQLEGQSWQPQIPGLARVPEPSTPEPRPSPIRSIPAVEPGDLPQPGELVLVRQRQYLGSGSVGAAAIAAERSFAGNDLATEAVDVTRARLLEAGGELAVSTVLEAPRAPGQVLLDLR